MWIRDTIRPSQLVIPLHPPTINLHPPNRLSGSTSKLNSSQSSSTRPQKPASKPILDHSQRPLISILFLFILKILQLYTPSVGVLHGVPADSWAMGFADATVRSGHVMLSNQGCGSRETTDEGHERGKGSKGRDQGWSGAGGDMAQEAL